MKRYIKSSLNPNNARDTLIDVLGNCLKNSQKILNDLKYARFITSEYISSPTSEDGHFDYELYKIYRAAESLRDKLDAYQVDKMTH